MKKKAGKMKKVESRKSKVGNRNTKRYALLSVSDKTGLDKLAKGLRELGFELVSSGGTAKFLREKLRSALPISREI